MTDLNELLCYGIENASILECPCACQPDGTFSLFGLAYRSPAWDVIRGGLDAESAIVAVVDPEDMTKVLLREPTCGWLLSATLLEPGRTGAVSLWGHLRHLAWSSPDGVLGLEKLVAEAFGIEDERRAA